MASYYDPANYEIVVQREYAHDVDVVAREYIHSILSVRDMSSDFEVMGLESGLADYYVGSALDKSELYEDAGPIRLSNERSFNDPFDTDDVGNDLGEIWAGAFWLVRTLLGSKEADAAIWNAWMDADDAAEGEGIAVRNAFVNELVAVVTNRCGKEKAQEVRDIFAARGLRHTGTGGGKSKS